MNRLHNNSHKHTHTHKPKKWKILTKPAMGVESLFTRLMIPGFNLLIKLCKKEKVRVQRSN